MRRASSWSVTNHRTSRSRSSTSLISSSTSPSTLAGTAEGVLKSKRSRPGALSEPACAALSPSVRRSAGVQQVGGRVAARHRGAPVGVDLGEHGVARAHLAGEHGDAVRDQPGHRLLHVDDGQLGLAAVRS